MANRKSDRYTIYIKNPDTKECTETDLLEYIGNSGFIIGNIIKYVWRGWDDIEDLKKAQHYIKKWSIFRDNFPLSEQLGINIELMNLCGNIPYITGKSLDMLMFIYSFIKNIEYIKDSFIPQHFLEKRIEELVQK